MNIKNLYHYWREIKMSCLHNEEILENLFEQIKEEYPTLNENEQIKLNYEHSIKSNRTSFHTTSKQSYGQNPI